MTFSSQAQAAKEAAKKRFPDAAVGLTWHKGQEAIKVNLMEALASDAEAPLSIEGVPLVFSVIGKVRKQEIDP